MHDVSALPGRSARRRPLLRALTARRLREGAIHVLLAGAAALTLGITLAIVVALARESLAFFAAVSPGAFLTGLSWEPLFADPSYGVIPLVAGTVVVSAIAMLVAAPLGLLAAIWLSEYASPRARRVVKPALEVIVGVPTVVFGYFALTFVTPDLLNGLLGLGVGTFNALAAGLVVGIATLPVVASVADDAMRAVPGGMREGAFALGLRRRHVALRVVVPAALSGITAAMILAFAKIVGETMIVAMAAGGLANLGFDPREAYATMTAFIAQTGQGDVAVGSTAYESIFAVGALLFVITLACNVVASWVVGRFREEYE